MKIIYHLATTKKLNKYQIPIKMITTHNFLSNSIMIKCILITNNKTTYNNNNNKVIINKINNNKVIIIINKNNLQI